MNKRKPVNPIVKWTLIILANYGLLTTAAGVFWNRFVVPDMKVIIQEEIENHHDDKTGTLEAKVAQGLNRDQKLVAPVLVQVIKGYANTRDSIGNFTRDYYPALQEYCKYHDVGLKVDTTTGLTYYMNERGVLYRAAPSSEDKTKFFYLNEQNKWIKCRW